MCGVLCWKDIKDTRKAEQHHAELKDRLVDDTEWLAYKFIDKAIVSFRNKIQSFVDETDGQCHITNTLFKYKVSSRQLIFIVKTSELLMKSCAKFDFLFIIIQCATACSTIKFKLLYLLNHNSCCNKICSMCYASTYI